MIRRFLITLSFAALGLLAACSKDDPYCPSPVYPDFSNFPTEEEQEDGLPSGFYAQGHIWYDDNKPAVGVTVSDGFNVTLTDDSGYYSLRTTSDSWYVYFSHPSDAAIEKNADGCPYYFKRYQTGKHVYDFCLNRIEPENDFILFALADPQAHYQPRSYEDKAHPVAQTMPDTDRFRDEVVPAVNAHIREQGPLPCYGVTLGDIVYSEGGRNSTPGMDIMRSHFAGIDMPVFQTMGNHDYTFFRQSSPLKPDETSSTAYLKAQRVFEESLGPVNHSFNRGKVHFVCMRNVIYDATTYHGGFTSAQIKWLREDLKNVSADNAVVLCVHIPLSYASEGEYVDGVLNLLKGFTNSSIFAGHKHFHRGVDMGGGLFEHIHSAVCGQWWWSRIGGDGVPAGYTLYRFSGNTIRDSWFLGYNEGMNTRDGQMRIYRGGLEYGGPHALFRHPTLSRQILINVFNGDETWTVKAIENGVEKRAVHMGNVKQTFSPLSDGAVCDVSTSSSQDWWAIGYHIGVLGLGMDNTSYYPEMHHMWKATLGSDTSELRVEVEDPYGNVYSSSDVIASGTDYPENIKTKLR
ncbi:MAG: calcineurin-like phosphoesterase family protein [Bacteroidales bacterium]|nr:calcineurin-like phosphoesterase family protein [Bacteroidales bacterium]